jgi:inosine/xanthosine triphosphate pyrophosphatase family protein
VDIGVKPSFHTLNLCILLSEKWFRFIARGALGGQLSQQPQIEYGFCYDFNLEKDVFA